MNRKLFATVVVPALVGLLLADGTARASNVLLVNVHGEYDGDAANLHATLVDAGATTTYVNLSADGQAAAGG